MMHRDIRLEFRRRPSALAFMARVVRTSPGVRRGSVPAIGARWRHSVDPGELARFLALSGLPGEQTLPLLYPHTIGFPLHMAILTQPAFPLPIWRMLQVRNRILQHRPLAQDATLDIAVEVAGHRVLDKGAEFDLRTSVRDGSGLAWESVNTFYARGRYGAPTVDAAVPAAPKLVSVPRNRAPPRALRRNQKSAPARRRAGDCLCGAAGSTAAFRATLTRCTCGTATRRSSAMRAPSCIRSACSGTAWRACRRRTARARSGWTPG
ncbi:MAG: hypothetical protein IPG33_08660 [Betaproteobacteria bacterium]|nr:hypothetical protein [Betaproteobacteria bacterium]